MTKLIKSRASTPASMPNYSDYRVDPYKANKPDLKQKFFKAATVTIVGGAAIGIAAAAVGGIASCSHNYLEEKSVVATVTEKAIHVDGDKDSGVTSTYMIYTDHGVFTNRDSLSKGKFNSSDIYGQLKVGCTYKFNYHGFRNNVMSMYPNIDSFTVVSSPMQATTVPKI